MPPARLAQPEPSLARLLLLLLLLLLLPPDSAAERSSEPRGRARPVIDLQVAVQQHHGRGHLSIVLAQDHLPIQHHAYENAARK